MKTKPPLITACEYGPTGLGAFSVKTIRLFNYFMPHYGLGLKAIYGLGELESEKRV
jgi:hypothetical protein